MEQLSFASMYRNAAILAAFSHASAAGGDLDGRAPWSRRAEGPLLPAAMSRAVRLFLDTCEGHLRRGRGVAPARTIAPQAASLTDGWGPTGHADGWGSMGPHRPCVTSHFAFTGDAERVGSRS